MDPIVHKVSADEVTSTAAKEIYNKFIEAGKSVPKWMEVMANNEDIMVGFFTMFKATMDDAPIPAITKWKVADEVSRMNGCEFCIDVTKAQLRQFGIAEDMIEKINDTADEKEKAALAYARAVTEKPAEIPQETIDAVKSHYNDEELVELVAVIGLFNYINRFNDALGVFPE